MTERFQAEVTITNEDGSLFSQETIWCTSSFRYRSGVPVREFTFDIPIAAASGQTVKISTKPGDQP
jgi:hypothetical protein